MNGTLVLPKTTAPAARYFSTTAESVSAMLSLNSGTPHVVGDPARSKLSLTVTGRPSRGPVGSPAARRPVRGVGFRTRALDVLPDDGVDCLIVPIDAVEKVIEQLARADLARIEHRHQSGGGLEVDFGHPAPPVRLSLRPGASDRRCVAAHADYLALLRKKLKLASCPAKVTAFAWQPMHVPP